MVLTNDAGTATTTYTYDPFGNTTVNGPSTNAFQFTGRENDGTGLYYYRARYYSPTFHRFISEDPIGLDGGDENFYAYTLNSPTNFIDPSGEIVQFCVKGALESFLEDQLAGRKLDLENIAFGCLTGGIRKVF